jgi:DNA polymerase-3 subunit epsilon
MGRCLSPCLGDLDPNLYRRRLDAALGLFNDSDGGSKLLNHVRAKMRAAAAEQAFERAAWLRRRLGRLGVILERLGGVLEATHARPRLILAAHPTDVEYDAFWLVGGRLVDWGRLPERLDELEQRTANAIAHCGGSPHIPPDEVDEVRIVATWLASHPEAAQLPLAPAPARDVLERFVRAGAQLAAGAAVGVTLKVK